MVGLKNNVSFMSIEEIPSIEKGSRNREKLLLLEKEGKYVFHGSSKSLGVLEPRQGFDLNKETGKMEEDGAPAIFATPYADIAIFRALINGNGLSEESFSSFGIDGERLNFSATKNLIDKSRDCIGKVYVLDKGKFQNFEGIQCRSFEPNHPIQVIDVTFDDLPADIIIKDS